MPKQKGGVGLGIEDGLESVSLPLAILAGIVLVVFFIQGLHYIFGIDISGPFHGKQSYLTPQFFNKNSSASPSLSPSLSPSPASFTPKTATPSSVGEVFNIPKNKFTYQDAQTLCKAYDARLATYDEVEDSYTRGGEWCNYGWSDNHMILFPTQKSTYASLQKVKGHENDCGRPGVNGGVIANTNARFGVNCFGQKPDISDREKENMLNATLYPKSKEDIEFDKKTSFWKDHVRDILISPFNKTTWSIL